MILIRKTSNGQQYVHTVDNTYHETSEGSAIPRQPKVWRFAPRRGDGSKSLNNSRGIAALANNYHDAMRMIRDLEKMQ